MKRMRWLLLLSGMLCCMSCGHQERTADLTQKSEPAVQTEKVANQTPVELVPIEVTPAEAAPVVTEPAKTPAPTPQNPQVKIVTTKGDITIELYADKAPLTAANFLAYVNAGFYSGTIFHRVMSGFMIQGGGMTPDLRQKITKAPVKNESYNQLRNERGTIAMARTNAPDSATSQFFINHVNNRSLDFDGPYQPGYAVFGKVVEGMDVVDAIAAIPTKRVGANGNVPVETVVIESVTVVK